MLVSMVMSMVSRRCIFFYVCGDVGDVFFFYVCGVGGDVGGDVGGVSMSL